MQTRRIAQQGITGPGMIRLLAADDIEAAAGVWHRSGLEEYTYLPAFQALDTAQALHIFTSTIAQHCQVWLETSGPTVRGVLAIDQCYIDRLYVDPAHQRQGVGTALLNHAKQLCPQGLSLHTHQQNRRARRFYEQAGFVVARYGISPAPESMPDVEYRWPESSA